MVLVLGGLGLLPFFNQRHYLLVLVRGKHADERHHSHHRCCPALSESPRFSFCHCLVHSHHHVLGITRDTFLLIVAHLLSVPVLLLLRSNQGRSRLLGLPRHT